MVVFERIALFVSSIGRHHSNQSESNISSSGLIVTWAFRKL